MVSNILNKLNTKLLEISWIEKKNRLITVNL